jgi:hypothetical protein
MVAAVIPKHVISGRDRVQRRERDARAKERAKDATRRNNHVTIFVLYVYFILI